MPRLLISEPNKAPQPYRFPLDREFITIGNAPTNDIVINCESVSNEHCVIVRVEGGHVIRDKNSTNGIKQNNASYAVADLFNKSVILIGDIPLEFQLSEEELEAMRDENFVSQIKHALPKLPPTESSDSAQTGSTGNPLPPIEQLEVGVLPEAEEVSAPLQSLPSPALATPVNHAPIQSSPAMMATTESIGMGTVILLGTFSVIVGMCIKHFQDTGNFLVTELMVKIMG